MDRKLKNIENLIIEDTTKYYDNHDGEFSLNFQLMMMDTFDGRRNDEVVFG